MSRGFGRILSILAIGLVFVLCIGSGVVIGVISAALKNMPALEDFEYRPIEATRIYDVNNKLIAQLYVENRVWVPLSEMPKELQDAVIAVEDSKFREHHGIDFMGILRAFLVDIREGRIVQGGSTITSSLQRTHSSPMKEHGRESSKNYYTPSNWSVLIQRIKSSNYI